MPTGRRCRQHGRGTLDDFGTCTRCLREYQAKREREFAERLDALTRDLDDEREYLRALVVTLERNAARGEWRVPLKDNDAAGLHEATVWITAVLFALSEARLRLSPPAPAPAWEPAGDEAKA